MDRYTFPAQLCYETPDQIGVIFPDLPGCVTVGTDEGDALSKAKEALGLHLYSMETDGEKIPVPSRLRDLPNDENSRYILVDVWMPYIRSRVKVPSVKKTLTIPAWLDQAAHAAGVNYSQVLQGALREILSAPRTRQ